MTHQQPGDTSRSVPAAPEGASATFPDLTTDVAARIQRSMASARSAGTRRAYASALDRMVRDFGADGDVGLLNPDRVSGWFDYVWGDKAPKTYNLRLTAVSAACAY